MLLVGGLCMYVCMYVCMYNQTKAEPETYSWPTFKFQRVIHKNVNVQNNVRILYCHLAISIEQQDRKYKKTDPVFDNQCYVVFKTGDKMPLVWSTMKASRWCTRLHGRVLFSTCVTAPAEYASDTSRLRCFLASRSNVTALHLRCSYNLQQRRQSHQHSATHWPSIILTGGFAPSSTVVVLKTTRIARETFGAANFPFKQSGAYSWKRVVSVYK